MGMSTSIDIVIAGMTRSELARALRRYKNRIASCDDTKYLRSLRTYYLHRFAAAYSEMRTRQTLKRWHQNGHAWEEDDE